VTCTTYPVERLYHEEHYAHGRKDSLGDEVNLIIFDPTVKGESIPARKEKALFRRFFPVRGLEKRPLL
jgi:hypothetical protein